MPELDDLLAGRLEQIVKGGELGEMESAATPACARRFAGYLQSCAQSVRRQSRLGLPLQAAMLAYLVRHGPTEAARLVNRALDARGTTGCYASDMTDVAVSHVTRVRTHRHPAPQ